MLDMLDAQSQSSSVIAASGMGQRGKSDANWQAYVLAEYANITGKLATQRRRELARRILALAGRTVPERAIIVDEGARWAMAVVDGMIFRLRGADLVVARPCVWCGTGHFESAAITNRADLGYALGSWQPYHPECEPCDPLDDVSW
jgi:hypothetical protein